MEEFDPRRDPGMQTPVEPLPAPSDEADGPRERKPPPPGGLRAAARAGLGYVLWAWRPLIAVVVVQLLLALTVVLPLQSRVATHLDAHAHAEALAGAPNAADDELGWIAGLDAGLWRDVRRLEADVFDGLTITLFWVILVAWLFGALAAGGFLGTAIDRHLPASAGRFFSHGGRNFGRMLRVGLVFLFLAWVAGRLVLQSCGGGAHPTGGWGGRLREGAFVLAFLWLRVAADAARADLVVYARRSALSSFARGLWRTVRHPVRTLGLALVVGTPALGLLLLLGLAPFGGISWPALLGTFLLVQLAVFVRWASRAALLAGLAHLVEAEVHKA